MEKAEAQGTGYRQPSNLAIAISYKVADSEENSNRKYKKNKRRYESKRSRENIVGKLHYYLLPRGRSSLSDER